MFTHYFPYVFVSLVVGVIYPICGVVYDFAYGMYDFRAMALNILAGLAGFYLQSLITGTLTVVRERRRIYCPPLKLFAYTLLFPWFELLYLPLFTIAIFANVQWLPIVHKDTKRIEDFAR
jgi:hypothetical protein